MRLAVPPGWIATRPPSQEWRHLVQTIPTIDLYRELEVDPAASFETIDAAWKSLLKRHHPDVTSDAAAAHERVKRLNLAHEWLGDPERRALYDRSRRQPGVVVVPRPPRSQSGRRGPSPAAPRPAAPGPATSSPRAGGWPAGDAAPPHNPYAEYDLPNRPRPAPGAPTPAAAATRPAGRRMPPLLVPLALLSVLAVVAGSSYIAMLRSNPGGAGSSLAAPSGAAADVRSGAGVNAASGVPDPRTLPKPDLAADLPSSCRPTNLDDPYTFEAAVGGVPAAVYVVHCLDDRSAGPLVYVASGSGWRLSGRLGFHDGAPYTAASGPLTGRSPDEFSIAWSGNGGRTTTLAVYQATNGLSQVWDSASAVLAWSLPRITWQAGPDPTGPGSLVIVSADLGTATCPTCRDYRLYRGVYAWDASVLPAGLRIQGPREPVGVGVP